MNSKTAVTLLGLATLIAVLYLLVPFTGIIVYSIFIYYIARPLYQKLESKVKSKGVSAFISMFVVVLPVILILLYTVGIASIELSSFVQTVDIPELQESAEMIEEAANIASELKVTELVAMVTNMDNITTQVVDFLYSKLGPLLFDIVASTINILFKLFLVLLISFYLLMDGSKIREWIEDSLFKGKNTASEFLSIVDAELSSIFFGNILTGGLIAVIASLLFTTINALSNTITIPYPVLMGILCGIASLIPVVGVALVWIPLTLYLIVNALVEGLFMDSVISIGLFLIGTFLLADWLPNILLRPRMTSKKMHKGLLLLSYIFGPIAFGLKGLFLGPIIVVVAVNFAALILPKMDD